MAQFYFPAMAVQVALVAFCCLLDFSQGLLLQQESSCNLTGLSCSNPVQATFFRFYRSVSDYTDVYKNNCSALTSAPGFDPRRNTTFYVHGWAENVTCANVITMTAAFTKVKEENFVSFNWYKNSGCNYLFAVSKIEETADVFLDGIECFIAAGLKPESIKLLGFSLGGQMVGAIGNMYQERHNETLLHITGLDPAGPCFYPHNNYLNKTSGKNVIAIHTTSGFAGYPAPMADADFLPNFGTIPQPLCPKRTVESIFNILGRGWNTTTDLINLPIICDHSCAWQYYAHTVIKKYEYVALCIDPVQCRIGMDKTFMGYATPDGTHGMYYLSSVCPDTSYIYNSSAN